MYWIGIYDKSNIREVGCCFDLTDLTKVKSKDYSRRFNAFTAQTQRGGAKRQGALRRRLQSPPHGA